MMAIFFLGIGAATVAAGFAGMSWELAAGLAAIGLLAAIYHPVGTAMLVAHAARRAWDRHQQRVGQSRSSFLGTTGLFVLVVNATHPAKWLRSSLPKRRNPL
jgi:hypothetical protein